jgi:hypothetical protein
MRHAVATGPVAIVEQSILVVLVLAFTGLAIARDVRAS